MTVTAGGEASGGSEVGRYSARLDKKARGLRRGLIV
jgi:hypothetical protein